MEHRGLLLLSRPLILQILMLLHRIIDVLTYSTSSSTWVNAQIPSGTTTIQGCTDVSITESGLSGTSNVFYWNHGDNKFECKTLSLTDLPNNTIINSTTGNNGLCSYVSSLASGNVLSYNGSNWVNSVPSAGSTLACTCLL